MGNWLQLFMRRGRGVNLFAKRKSSRNMLWPTLLGISIATIVSLRKNRSANMLAPVQNVMKQIRPQNTKLSHLATEFAQELSEKTKSHK